MKKTILLAAGSVLVGLSVMAEDLPRPATPPVIIVKEYFGTEATANPNNPCKGETTRICYRETQKILQVAPGKVKITRIGEGRKGSIIRTKEEIVDGTIESVVKDIGAALPLNTAVHTFPVDGTQSDK